jgi:hypothetical protein
MSLKNQFFYKNNLLFIATVFFWLQSGTEEAPKDKRKKTPSIYKVASDGFQFQTRYLVF